MKGGPITVTPLAAPNYTVPGLPELMAAAWHPASLTQSRDLWLQTLSWHGRPLYGRPSLRPEETEGPESGPLALLPSPGGERMQRLQPRKPEAPRGGSLSHLSAWCLRLLVATSTGLASRQKEDLVSGHETEQASGDHKNPSERLGTPLLSSSRDLHLEGVAHMESRAAFCPGGLSSPPAELLQDPFPELWPRDIRSGYCRGLESNVSPQARSTPQSCDSQQAAEQAQEW